jgi:hypothetical protein
MTESKLMRRIEDKIKDQQAQQVPQPVIQIPPPSLQIIPKVKEEQAQTVSKFVPEKIETAAVQKQISETAQSYVAQKEEPKGVLEGDNFVIKGIADSRGAIYDMSGNLIAKLKKNASGDSVWENASKAQKGTYIARVLQNATNPEKEFRLWNFYVSVEETA